MISPARLFTSTDSASALSRQPCGCDASYRWQPLLEDLPGTAAVGALGELPTDASSECCIDVIARRRDGGHAAFPGKLRLAGRPARATVSAACNRMRLGQQQRWLLTCQCCQRYAVLRTRLDLFPGRVGAGAAEENT